MARRHVVELPRSRNDDAIGSKAANLRFLLRHGFPVPRTFVIRGDACARCLAGCEEIDAELRAELAARLDPDTAYAVRSSANLEDRHDRSYAGQFQTLLDVRGVESVIAAVKTVCASAAGGELDTYLDKAGHRREDLRMAVIVQEMVNPVFSGVSFSRNPITGFSEIVVEAVPGRGDALVQEGVTPRRWVSKWGAYTVRPKDEEVPPGVIDAVIAGTKAIARCRRRPVDLEWVFDGDTVRWVQMRDITTLTGINVYSNAISREMLPGQVKPLVWSVNIPLVNTAWVRFFTELIGPNDIDPLQLARAFHYRTYFNMGVVGRIFDSLGMPADSLELMLGVQSEGPEKPRMMPSMMKASRHIFRMLGFAVDKLRFAGRIRRFLPRAKNWYDEFGAVDLAALDDQAVLERVDRLFGYTINTAYHNVCAPLLMFFYNRMLRTRLDKLGRDFALLDTTRGLDELAELDPNHHIERLRLELARLNPELQAAARTATGLSRPGLEGFRLGFEEFTARFGHLSDSGVDFSYVPWRERPDDVLGMIANYVPRAVGSGRQTLEEMGLFGRDIRRLRWLHARARQFRLLREQVSSLYIYGYGLFRPHFLELGRRWSGRGRLEAPEDIFYLYLDEVRALARGEPLDAAKLVVDRRKEMAACANARLPETIFGDAPPPLEEPGAGVLRGVATSRGYYRGPARVIRSTTGFGRLLQGDVLVIPFSDVGWTPLFARAGAVVAESGGILSHSSIVAREYGIPAVVSVPGALDLQDGADVTVDGFAGSVTIHINPKEA